MTDATLKTTAAAPSLVLGLGPDALIAAAVRAAGGERVLLLQLGPTPSGLSHPEVPLGTGRLTVAPEARAATEAVLGALVEAPSPRRALLLDGHVLPLPLKPWQVRELFTSESNRRAAARAWLGTRARNAVSDVVGNNSEERSYKDWVARRMGLPAYHHVYRPYAERRWGAPGSELSASVARVFHGAPEVAQQVLGGGHHVALENAERAVLDNGGEIRTGVQVTGLRVEDGRVRAILLGDDSVDVQGPLWVALPPHVVVPWLGDAASTSLQVDARAMRTCQALRVTLRGEVRDLPEEVHLVDETAPFFRAVRPYGFEDAISFHACRPAADAHVADPLVADRYAMAAMELGLGDFDREGARIDWQPYHHPVWETWTHVRHRRVLLEYRQLGLVGVGRSGAFNPMDMGQAVQFLLALRGQDDPDQRELHRALIDPPVLQADIDARITRFVAR